MSSFYETETARPLMHHHGSQDQVKQALNEAQSLSQQTETKLKRLQTTHGILGAMLLAVGGAGVLAGVMDSLVNTNLSLILGLLGGGLFIAWSVVLGRSLSWNPIAKLEKLLKRLERTIAPKRNAGAGGKATAEVNITINDRTYTLPQLSQKRARRSRTDRVLGGVAGGLANYLGMPSWVLRALLLGGLFISGGTATVVYLILWAVLPNDTSPLGQPGLPGQ